MAKKHPDQIKREQIPQRSDLATQYSPLLDNLMVIPLPDVTNFGSIILPNKHQIQLNEGHVVAKGPLCSDTISIGSCVLWAAHAETRFSTDDDNGKFVIVAEPNVPMFIPPHDLKGSVEPAVVTAD